MGGGEAETPDALAGEPLFAVCALAGPEFFFAILENLEADLKGRIVFPDHYSYKKDDLSKLMAQAEKQGAKALVTTHKDRVKIEPIWRELAANGEKPLPVWVLEIEARPEEGLWNMLDARLNIGKI